jgi:hypothetical protein
MKLTTRGWIVVLTFWFLAVIAFTAVTSNVCWTGYGYGACHTTIDASQNKETSK